MRTVFDPDRHHRRSIRLKGYDYAQTGAYFITICTKDRECLFGEVVDGEMRLNPLGEIARQCWQDIPDHFHHAALDAFVIMPNHVHGIIWIVNHDGIKGTRNPVGATRANAGARHAVVGATHASPLPKPRGPKRHSVGAIVGSFKSAVTKRINEMRKTPGAPIWQRNYYEHIIRNDESLNRIRRYIAENPLRWHLDRENPERIDEDNVWEELFVNGTGGRH